MPEVSATEIAMGKELKTNAGLETMIMDRVRKNADWWHVKSAIVTPLRKSAPHLPNWDATFVVDGAALRPEDIHYLIAAFQNQYDLADA
ncbi:MAG TPA: hypothetical protein VGG11_13030 [Xanthobacteraceae bacterium]